MELYYLRLDRNTTVCVSINGLVVIVCIHRISLLVLLPQAARRIQRCFRRWHDRLAGKVLLRQQREGLLSTATQLQREAVATRAKSDRLRRENARNQAEMEELRAEIRNLKDALRLAQDIATTQRQQLDENSKWLSAMSEELSAQRRRGDSLQSSVTDLTAYVESLTATSQRRLLAMQAAVSANDDLQLRAQEYALEKQRLKKALKKSTDKHGLLTKRAGKLEHDLAMSQREVGRLHDALKEVHAQASGGAKQTKAQLNEVLGVLSFCDVV